MLNNLSSDQVVDLGLKIVSDEINNLWGTLYPGLSVNDFEHRFAPSIIVRGECEILGRSYPRFAVRVLIQNVGIVNLRRKQCLLDSFSHPDGTFDDFARRARKIILDVFHNPRGAGENYKAHFADCLLIPPSTSSFADCHFITTDLWEAYGEDNLTFSQFNRRKTVPFMNHIRFGGGMCAQAACFITSLLNHQQIRGIYGIPEITEIAKNDTTVDELDFGGLNQVEVRDYFRHAKIGMHAFIERYDQEKERGAAADPHSNDAMARLAFALRSYVLSGVPIILPINIEILRHIEKKGDEYLAFRENYLEHFENDEDLLDVRQNFDPSRANHCIVVSGVSPDGVFVVTDPAGLPFIRFGIGGLFMASQTTYDEVAREELDLGAEEETDEETFRREGKDVLHMIPVVPRRVRLPFLIDIFTPSDNLATDQFYVQRLEHSVSNVIRRLKKRGDIHTDDHLECRLVEWSDKQELNTLEGSDQFALSINDESVSLKKHFASADLPKNHWYWIIAVRKAEENKFAVIHVVDAELDVSELPSHLLMTGILDFYVKKTFDLSAQLPDSAMKDRVIEDETTVLEELGYMRYRKKPRLAILSSFHINSFRKTVDLWDDNWPRECELYTFMQSTANELQDQLRKQGVITSPRNLNAADFLTLCGRGINVHSPTQVAEIIANVLDEWVRDKQIKFVSFASFLPGLSCPSTSQQAQLAKSSLYFLGNLCFQLQLLDHPLRKIELVSGSRMDNFDNRTTDPQSRPELVAAKIPAQRACLYLVSNLVSSLRRINNVRITVFSKNPKLKIPNLALEAEPGPLFSLSDFNSVFQFCRLLNTTQRSSFSSAGLLRFVGLNLDISHWAISENDNTEESVTVLKALLHPNNTIVFNRICGAHISGSHRAGHFGDIAVVKRAAVPPMRNSSIQLNNWIRLIAKKMNTPTVSGYPEFDRRLVLECEATKDVANINTSLDTLRQCLRTV